MLWLPYFILAYATLGLQIGLKAPLSIGEAWPNLVLLTVIFIALNAPRDAALLGAFGLGVLQDITTSQTLGLFALSYGLVAMFTVSTQQLVYRGHPLTHFSLALFGGFVCGMIMLINGWIRPPGVSPVSMFYMALYTAFLSIPALALLNRLKRVFSFQPARRRMRL